MVNKLDVEESIQSTQNEQGGVRSIKRPTRSHEKNLVIKGSFEEKRMM